MSLLKWALIMLVVSLVAALFGFTGLSAASADVARILFYIFIVIFLVLLVFGLLGARPFGVHRLATTSSFRDDGRITWSSVFLLCCPVMARQSRPLTGEAMPYGRPTGAAFRTREFRRSTFPLFGIAKGSN